MVNKEKEPAENPYGFTKEELTYSWGGGRDWLDPIIARQREGIDHGISPKRPRGLPKYLKRIWRREVWGYHLSTLSAEDRRAIRMTRLG